MIRSRCAALLAALELTCACDSGRNLAEQRSAAQVARAIEVLRKAPNAAKAPALHALARLPCTGEQACRTQAVCRAAYQLHVQALELTQAAKQKLAAGADLDAARALVTATEKLKTAGAQVGDCTDREAALRHHYKL